MLGIESKKWMPQTPRDLVHPIGGYGRSLYTKTYKKQHHCSWIDSMVANEGNPGSGLNFASEKLKQRRHGWIDGLGWCPSSFFSFKWQVLARCIGTYDEEFPGAYRWGCILRRSDRLNSHRSCSPTSPTFTFAGAISRHASLQASWTKYDQIMMFGV